MKKYQFTKFSEITRNVNHENVDQKTIDLENKQFVTLIEQLTL